VKRPPHCDHGPIVGMRIMSLSRRHPDAIITYVHGLPLRHIVVSIFTIQTLT